MNRNRRSPIKIPPESAIIAIVLSVATYFSVLELLSEFN